MGTVQPGDPAEIVENTFSLDNFVGLRGRQGEQATDRRAQLGAGRGHRRRHLVAAVLRLGAARAAARLEARIQGGAGAAAARLRRDRRQRSRARPTARCGTAEIDAVAAGGLVPRLGPLQAGDPRPVQDRTAEHADPDRQRQRHRAGCWAWRWRWRASPGRRWLRWPARVYTDIFRGLPEVVIILLIGLGVGPMVGGLTGNNPYPLGIAALGLMAAAYIGEIFRSGIQSVEAGQLEASRALGFSYPVVDAAGGGAAGHSAGAARAGEPVHLAAEGPSLVYFLGLVANQRELFQVGRDLNAQTGNLSPLVAAGLFYLLLTIPLTHLVNYIDARLRTRQTRRAGGSAATAEPGDRPGDDLMTPTPPAAGFVDRQGHSPGVRPEHGAARRRHRRARGHDRRGDRAVRLGQVDAAAHAEPALRTRQRRHPARRPVGAAATTRTSCGNESAWCSSTSTCSRTARVLDNVTLAPRKLKGLGADAARELGAGAAGPGWPAAQGRCPARERCPAASSSGSRSPARWR